MYYFHSSLSLSTGLYTKREQNASIRIDDDDVDIPCTIKSDRVFIDDELKPSVASSIHVRRYEFVFAL